MLGFIVSGVARVVAALNRYLPSLRLIQRVVHRRDSHKWGVPAMLLAVPYFLLANGFKSILEEGGHSLLSVPLLWCLVMGIAFVALGPIGLFLLAKCRVQEVRARRKLSRVGAERRR
ncbi:hypothetical protein MUN76_05940 [Leucobacter rhizosphaerae]|uniref:Sulfate permease n=1 Tax=Leucobacter rhizosphaerae TaxID=2932245 RepID=A0ABY4FYZ2_9MICO|nr:hypothetical protein [Leucobacter rhizosphaerae]UOQ61506.1 hypothetical protein MUN76_05940 [Leucobacter rhizosphaerae]